METRPRSKSFRPTALGPAALALAALAFAPAAFGDVVKMIDGRSFEGTITEDSAVSLRIDAMIDGIPVKLGLRKNEVESIEKKAVPPDFFKTEPKAEARVSRADAFPPGTTLYIEIPIVGRIGKQVVPRAIERCLTYAVANGIPNVLFFVDSHGGDLVAARQIFKSILKFETKLTYRALVRDALGVAAVIPILSKDVFILPGGGLGGIYTGVKEDDEAAWAVDVAQTAHEAGQKAEKYGWPAAIVRAMIDPAAQVFAWRDADGKLATSSSAPEPTPNFIVQDGPESTLTLTASQVADLGLARPYGGNASGLGAELGIEKWTAESDFGKKTVAAAAQEVQKKQASVAARNEAEGGRLLRRREMVQNYIDRNLALAHEWDPEQNTRSTYEQNSARWDQYWGGGAIAQSISPSKWRALTDSTMNALREAGKGVIEMKKLDEKCSKLGIEPAYKPGELDKMLQDIELKLKKLDYWRNRKTS